jgi:hypothetical protein
MAELDSAKAFFLANLTNDYVSNKQTNKQENESQNLHISPTHNPSINEAPRRGTKRILSIEPRQITITTSKTNERDVREVLLLTPPALSEERQPPIKRV